LSYQSICVWAQFSVNGRTPSIRIEGNLNQGKHVTVLKEQLLPFPEKDHGGTNDFILEQDGCGPHRGKSVRSCLEADCIDFLPRPAQSPYLNRIENAWTILKQNLREQNTYPTYKAGLFERLSDIWDSIPSSYFEALIASMTTKVKELKKVKSLSTRY